MRTLVVYFSRSGHTRRVAVEIAGHCGGDLEEIWDARTYGGVWDYLRSAWESLTGTAPPIEAAEKDPSAYDVVILGTPVWVRGLASPVRAYAMRNAKRFKQVAFFCTAGEAGNQQAFAELGRLCGKPPVATFVVTEAQLADQVEQELVQRFVTRLAAA
jgi:flavodoxin